MAITIFGFRGVFDIRESLKVLLAGNDMLVLSAPSSRCVETAY